MFVVDWVLAGREFGSGLSRIAQYTRWWISLHGRVKTRGCEHPPYFLDKLTPPSAASKSSEPLFLPPDSPTIIRRPAVVGLCAVPIALRIMPNARDLANYLARDSAGRRGGMPGRGRPELEWPGDRGRATEACPKVRSVPGGRGRPCHRRRPSPWIPDTSRRSQAIPMVAGGMGVLAAVCRHVG